VNGALERLFGLERSGTSLRTEAAAGATTFLTMAYIVAVNPTILGQAGMPIAGVAAATCISAGIASILMGLLANYPLALAPGMGLNAYFAFTVVKGMGLPWQTALGCVFISGLGFLILTLAGARRLIVEAIPRPLFAATGAGIGLFIAFLGLKDAGIVVADPSTAVALGDLSRPGAIIALAGLLVMAALLMWRVKAAILIGILAATALAWAIGAVPAAPLAYSLSDLSSTAFRLDIPAALNLNGGPGLALIEIIVVFLFVDVFDNVGTLVGVAGPAGIIGKDGSIPRLNRVLAADSLGAMAGALAGTSTVTSYIESASGVAVGGRTGLTGVVTGVLFLAAAALAPLAKAIPVAAAAPALVLVGSMMMSSLKDLDWEDPGVAIPAFLTLVGIPLTFSIASGLAFGVIAWAVLRVVRGQARAGDWLAFLLAGLFAARFAWIAAA
jgi:AGZA family xanthine/uracil permease-like MFS transporter